ncbi:MAG: DNA polymerase III subunit gamma/tau [Actinomycetota bacterium]
MSQALYRRWRPRTFTDVVGQEHVTETLRASIREGRISHAYLFSGPRGTGKTSTARILAKAFNCASGPTPDPCDTCESCVAINDGISLDVIEIDAASHGGVDDVRVLRENAVLAPALARKKVYIVDEAHMVSTAGWNAFLKTVEEPPAHIAFVFATTEPNKVLPTIVSRCQRFEFRRVSTAAIADHLGKICAEEGLAADDAALSLIARHSEGGVRDALSILDQLAAGGSVTADVTRRLLGGAPTDILFDFTDALASRDTGAALRAVAGIVNEGGDVRQFVRQVLEHLRALFVIQRVDDPTDLVDVTEETLARLTAQAGRFRGEPLVHALRLFADAQAEMRQQAPPRLTTEVAVVRATVPEADTTAEAALARIERLERILDIAGAPATQTHTEPPSTSEASPQVAKRAVKAEEPPPPKRSAKKTAAPEPQPAEAPAPRPAAAGLVDLDKIKRDWPLVLEEVRKIRKSLHALLSEGRPRALEADKLELECRYEFHARQLAEAKNAAVVAEAVRSVFGVSLRIGTSLGAPTADAETGGDDEISEESADPLDVLSSRLGAEVIEETED